MLTEVIAVKHSFGTLLLALAHRGIPRDWAAGPAMRGLPHEQAKATATRIRDAWDGTEKGN